MNVNVSVAHHCMTEACCFDVMALVLCGEYGSSEKRNCPSTSLGVSFCTVFKDICATEAPSISVFALFALFPSREGHAVEKKSNIKH